MKRYYLLLVLMLCSVVGFTNPPPAAEVFQLLVKPVDPNTFVLQWKVKPGYFLYKDKIQLIESKGDAFTLGILSFPVAIQKSDSQGKINLVYNDLSLFVSVLGAKPGEGLLNVHYQGCSEDGFCYPPQSKQVKLTIDPELALTAVSIEDQVVANAPVAAAPESDMEQIFSSNNWFLIILIFFGLGLLLAFTPCVLPMVPVLSGIIVGHGKNLSTRKAFFLSLSYVLSMSLTYALVGAVVALMGNNLQIALQSPWAIGAFSLIFVLLAVSMFGFYELRLPVSWHSKLAQVTRGQAGGHYVGAAIMGSLSTLILSPCVTAPLIGALGYIAHSGNVALGVLTLFFLGLGMGTPLLLIGTSAGKLLPKAGVWMNGVKGFFGVVMLAMAIYLLDRIIPATVTMGLWACLLIFSGIYIGALTGATSNSEKFRQATGIIFLGYGLLILVGASNGNTNPLQPLAFQNNSNYVPAQEPMQTVKTLAEAKQALQNAKGSPVMLDFYADWCASCKHIAATTLQAPQVLTALKDFTVVKVDLTANNAATKELLTHFNVVAPPTFLFIDAQGKELDSLRVVGETTVEAVAAKLDQAKML